MAAASAVLDTYELLEHIVVQLPPLDITRITRVARLWYDLIKRSYTIRDALISAPMQKLFLLKLSNVGLSEILPLYSAESGIDFLPDFTKKRSYSEDSHERYKVLSLDIYDYPGWSVGGWDIWQKLGEFVTRPPCQAIHLRTERDLTGLQVDTTVYVKDGVRIKDLETLPWL